jgi:hypothetical protein
MKLTATSLFFLATCGLILADDIPQGAIDYFAQLGHEHPDTIRIVEVDLKGDGTQQYLMTFAKGDWSGPDAVWSVVENDNGVWKEPKMLDIDGQVKDFSGMTFDPLNAAFIYLPSYKRKGLLAQWKHNWTFTYLLDSGVLFTTWFWTPSQAGLTEKGIEELIKTHKVAVVQKAVP